MSSITNSFPASMKDSGLPWLGFIPNHWNPARGKDVLIKRRVEPQPNDGVVTCFRDGQVTLRSNRRTEGFTIAAHEHGYQRVEVGNLVISAMDAFAGAIGISDSDGKCSPVYSVCKPRFSSEVYLPFYMYALRDMASNGYISSVGKGIRERSSEFRFSEIYITPFARPPHPEQIAIADYLDKTTALIDKQRALLERKKALLKEHKKALIHEAVTKGLTPGVAMKPSGVEWIGDVPSHWQIFRAKDFLEEICAPSVDGLEDLLAVSAYYGVKARRDVVSEGAEISRAESLVGYKICKGNQLVVNTMLAWNGSMGISKQLGIVSPSYAVYDIDQCRAAPSYLGYLLKSVATLSIIRSVSRGINDARLRLYPDSLGAIQFVLPPLSEQIHIAKHLDRTSLVIDSQCALLDRKIELINSLRLGIIHEAVTRGVPA